MTDVFEEIKRKDEFIAAIITGAYSMRDVTIDLITRIVSLAIFMYSSFVLFLRNHLCQRHFLANTIIFVKSLLFRKPSFKAK